MRWYNNGIPCSLNRDVIKYLAVFAMLLNHISSVFLEKGTFLGELFLDIGYFTAPVMCYFLVEGYYYTHSRKKYLQRLFLFALISQTPFYLALSHGEPFPGMLNMMFTLVVCFLIMEVKTKVPGGTIQTLLYALLVLMNSFCDWPTMASVYTLLFAYAYGSHWKLARAFLIASVIFMLPMYMTNSLLFPTEKALLLTGGAVLGVLAAAAVILYLYNGKQVKCGRKFSKWFFYIFYPAHLLIIGIIRMIVA